MERNHKQYFGNTGNLFVVVSEFSLTTNNLKIGFDTFASTESFDIGNEPLLHLRREFVIKETEFANLKTENKDFFKDITEQVLDIIKVGSEFSLDYFQILTTKWVIVVNAKSATREINQTITAPEYHSIIADNTSLVLSAINMAWEYGKQKDDYLASLN
jgi:hypothetical protein